MARISEYPHNQFIKQNKLDTKELPATLQKTIEQFTTLYNKTKHEKGQQIDKLVTLSNEIVAEIKEWLYESEPEAEASTAPDKVEAKDKNDMILATLWNDGVRYVSKQELKEEKYPTSLGVLLQTKHFKLKLITDKTSKRVGMYQIIKK